MARGPYSATDFLKESRAPFTAYPFTLSCWLFGPENLGTKVMMACCNDTNDTDRVYFYLQSTRRLTGWFGASGESSGLIVSNGVWHHCALRAVSSTSRTYYVDNTSSFKSTSRTFSGLNSWTVGNSGGLNPFAEHSGYIAHTAIWDIDIGVNAIASLSNGASPLMFPEGLKAYCPLSGASGSDEINFAGGNLVDQGTTPSYSGRDPLQIMPGVPVVGYAGGPAPASGWAMGSLAGNGGLAGACGLAGIGGGLAG